MVLSHSFRCLRNWTMQCVKLPASVDAGTGDEQHDHVQFGADGDEPSHSLSSIVWSFAICCVCLTTLLAALCAIAIIISCPLPAAVSLLAMDYFGSAAQAQAVTGGECP